MIPTLFAAIAVAWLLYGEPGNVTFRLVDNLTA